MSKIETPIEFLRWLRPGGPWSLTAIVPDGKITTRLFTDLGKAAAWIRRWDGKANLYYAVNPLREGTDPNKKAGKTDVAALAFLHVDVDHLGVEHLARLREHEPSVIIMSGGGYNALWRLEDPVPAPDDGDWSSLEAYNKRFEELFSADHCHNVDRILRLPFTWNLPNEKKRKAGRTRVKSDVLEANALIKPLSAFQAATEGPGEPTDPPPGDNHQTDTEASLDPSALNDSLRDKLNDAGEPDRSAHVVAVAASLLRAGVSGSAIEAVLVDEEHACSAHCLAQDDSARAARRAVSAAQKLIKDNTDAVTAVFQFADSEPTGPHYSSSVAKKLGDTYFSPQKREALVVRVSRRSHESKSSVRSLFNTTAPPPRPTAFLEAYVYVTRPKVFIHRESLREYDREQFDNHHATRWPIGGRGPTASKVFLNEGGTQKYEPTYRPGGEEFIDDKFNIWQDTGIKPTFGDVTPWLEHGEWLVPDERARNIILDRMAFDVQHPELKPMWHVFLGGDQGIGKNLWTYPLVAAVGIENHNTVDPTMLESGYGDWMQGRKIIFVDEMMNFKRVDFNNRLKPLLAKPPLLLLCNKKYGGVFRLPNTLSFWMGSNLKDALKLENSDRRLMMNWTDVKPREKAYYQKLWAWYGTQDSDWLDNHVSDVVGWLVKRDLSKFSASDRAPMTEYKAAVILASRDSLEAYLQEARDAEEWPLHTDLVSIYTLMRLRWAPGLGRVTMNRLATALTNIGAECLGRVVVSKVGAKPKHQPTIWAVRPRSEADGFGWTDLTVEALREAVRADLKRWEAEDPGP